MNADDEVCMCFHVSFRKVINFMRQVRPTRASELSNCFSAGTGCGWCRPILRQVAEIPAEALPGVEELEGWVQQNFPGTVDEARENRAEYRRDRQIK